MPPAADPFLPLLEIIARHWGFRSLRPLQQQAMQAVLAGRDSLVVLPTGGGKSLCYQAPAVHRGGTTVVVSPLIALMKDQVDSLHACGISAARLDSSLSDTERFAYEMDLRQGGLRLVFVSPERLVNTDLYRDLQKIGVNTFAIDEAHCISHWGHQFRPEYRQLRRLRDLFPQSAVHAYTATATDRVRGDIMAQLGLRNPVILVGDFDRPNLTYRVLPRQDALKQTLDVLDRHAHEAGIIYCLRKRDVDDLAAALQKRGIRCTAYHADMTGAQREAAQDDFRAERVDVVVATVAFGMGIDRSNVRFVLHTAMPKTLEHYQQETGRAGRDGLEAECILLYSGADFLTWRWILNKEASEPGVDPSFLPSAVQHLNDMDRFARGAICRHRALVEYFGQAYEKRGRSSFPDNEEERSASPFSCQACDICLGDTEEVPEAMVVAQKILSCVARVQERFGIGHVAAVLRGENTENIRKWGHDKLTTFGLLKGHSKPELRDWIYQLLSQNVLVQAGEEYPILKLNDASWQVMRGQCTVRLIQTTRRAEGEKPEKSRAAEVSWEGVDQPLFEALRDLRRRLAQENGVPPYIVFSDTTLRDLARTRPSTLEAMRLIYGIGDNKLRSFGDAVLTLLTEHCRDRQLPMDVAPSRRAAAPATAATSANTLHRDAIYDQFRKGASVEDVMRTTALARSTVMNYLADYIQQEKPAAIDRWVNAETCQRVIAAARQVGVDRLKPIFLALGEKVPYDVIRLVVARLKGSGAEAVKGV